MVPSTNERRIRRWVPTRPPARATAGPRADLPVDRAVRVAVTALTEHPGTTIDGVEVDGHGVYTAHLVTRSGQRVVVVVDGALTVRGSVALAR